MNPIEEQLLGIIRKEVVVKEGRLFRLLPDVSWREFRAALEYLEHTGAIQADSFSNWIIAG